MMQQNGGDRATKKKKFKNAVCSWIIIASRRISTNSHIHVKCRQWLQDIFFPLLLRS